jgi:hypothetical protein
MQGSTIFHETPLWLLFFITVLLLVLAVQVGFRTGRLRRRTGGEEKNAPIGGLVGAALGLLAFVLAFTFSAAASRYDNRKQIVLQEANAIGTAYLRADLLPEALRSDARSALVDYTRIRARGVTELLRPEMVAESAALTDRLWGVAVSAGNQRPDQPVTALFIQAVNDVIDLSEARVTAGRNEIPGVIWGALYLLAILSMAAVGYQLGLADAHSWVETVLLVLAFSMVILLIADLDRPQGGLVRVSQQPLLDLLNSIAAGN